MPYKGQQSVVHLLDDCVLGNPQTLLVGDLVEAARRAEPPPVRYAAYLKIELVAEREEVGPGAQLRPRSLDGDAHGGS
jgi:hypothetical protein